MDIWIGREDLRRDTVDPGAVARFHATLDLKEAPDSVPPGFHWCLCHPDAPLSALGEDGHPQQSEFLPVPKTRRMWAASDVEFRSSLHFGEAVQRTSRIAGLERKDGRSGELIFVTVLHETASGTGLAIRERQTLVYRDPPSEALALPGTGTPPDLSGWDTQRTLKPDERLLFRYSALTFNAHRIHYDRDYARDVEGYPELVVQGPLIATLLLQLCAPRRIASLSFRGVSPAYCGQPLHLARRDQDGAIDLCAFGDDGRTVMEATATLSS